MLESADKLTVNLAKMRDAERKDRFMRLFEMAMQTANRKKVEGKAKPGAKVKSEIQDGGPGGKTDAQWKALPTMPVGDQSDWRTMEVHPAAEEIKQDLVEKGMVFSLDGRALALLSGLNVENINLFINSYAPRDALELDEKGLADARNVLEHCYNIKADIDRDLVRMRPAQSGYVTEWYGSQSGEPSWRQTRDTRNWLCEKWACGKRSHLERPGLRSP